MLQCVSVFERGWLQVTAARTEDRFRKAAAA
jgi:hypothetical protein